MDLEGLTPFGASPDTDLSTDAGEEPERLEVGGVDYNLDWPEERRLRLGRRICAQIDDYLTETSELRSILETVRDSYAVTADPQPEGPWPDSANVNTGATRWVCNGHHIRLNQQILLASPPFTVVARSESGEAVLAQLEEALEGILLEADWPRAANLVHGELPVAGNVFLKVVYDIQYRRVPRRQVEHEPAISSALIAGGFDPVEAALAGLKRDRNGRVRRLLGFEDRLTYAGVKLTVIPWEDGVIVPSSARSWQEAYGIGERLVLTGEELRRGARAGKYIEEEVEELLRRGSDPPDEGARLRWDQQGIAPGAQGTAAWGEMSADEDSAPYKEFVCYELCYRLDGNDDGEMEWCVVTVHKETARVLRLQYLPWEHGRPHYVLFTLGEEAGKLFATGIAELISGLVDSHAAVLNQILDHGDYVHNMHGNFFYDKSSGFEPAKREIALGTPIPVRDVRGIQQIQIAPLPPEHYQVLDTLRTMIDLLSQTSNPALGRETETQKTLGEVQIVMGAANQQFEDTAAHVARTWAEVFDLVRWLAAQFPTGGAVRYRRAPQPALEFLAPGAQPAGQMGSISVEDLLADVDILPTGFSQLADAQMRLQRAQVMLTTLAQHPLTAENTAVQLIALDDYLQQFRHPQRERIMGAVLKGLAMQVQAAAKAQGLAAMQQGTEPGTQATLGPPAANGAMPANGAAPPPIGIAA